MTMSLSFWKMACDGYLWKVILKFSMSMKKTFLEMTCVSRTIFESISTISMRLFIFQLSLIAISIFKHNLDRHNSINNNHYNFLFLLLFKAAKTWGSVIAISAFAIFSYYRLLLLSSSNFLEAAKYYVGPIHSFSF